MNSKCQSDFEPNGQKTNINDAFDLESPELRIDIISNEKPLAQRIQAMYQEMEEISLLRTGKKLSELRPVPKKKKIK